MSRKDKTILTCKWFKRGGEKSVWVSWDVVCSPFGVRISWLDVQNSGDGRIVSREKIGFHIPCGRFKATRKASVNSVNIFSHVVDCDRAAREVYKIYPKKGSVWMLYGEGSIDADEGKGCYDIVVFSVCLSIDYIHS